MSKRGLRPGETPFTRKSCYDCKSCVGYVSLWCINENAVKKRGTQIPGCIHCRFWEPNWEYIDKEYQPPENNCPPTIKEQIKALWERLKLKIFR